MTKAKIAFRLFVFTVLLCTTFSSRAQETCATTSRNPFEWPGHRHWYIAPNLFSGATIDMSTMAVTSRGNAFGPVRSYEGVTAASDDAGNLLFYSNGRSVWTGGAGGPATETYAGLLEGNEGGINNGSASQGVITVRHPLDPDRYWIITTDDALSGTNGMNAFSFDAAGNNLSGPTRLGAFRTSEGITATLHENGVDVWVTCLASGTGEFHSFLLECDGFNDPAVVSSVGPTVASNRERGGLAFSWNGEYLAQAHPNFWPDGDKIVSIYRFNKETGVIYDAKNVSGTWGSPYDVSWSPDNSRVYVSMQSGQLHYLDITSWDATTINGTWTSTGVSTAFAAMEVGPDGSMYLSHGVAGGGFLRKVNGDLNSGTSFSTSNVAGTAGMSHLGLPTMYIPPAEEPDIEEVGPFCNTDAPVDLNTTWICSGLDAEDAVKNPTAYSGPGITDQGNGIFDPSVAGEGTHEIIFTYCQVNDTIEIVIAPCCTAELDDLTPEICVGETYTLDALVTDASGAGVWTIDSMPAGTSPVITTAADTVFDASNLAVAAGTYKLKFTVTDGGASCYDSIYIVVNPLPEPDLGADQEICIGDVAVTFDAGAFVSYLWQPNGETTQTIDTDVAGEYIVTVTDAKTCEGSDTVNLIVNPLPTPDLGADQEICIGDAAVTFDAGAYDDYAWQPGGETTQTIDTDVAGEYIVTVTDANGCEGNDTVNLVVNPLPTPDLGADQEICAGDAAVTFDAGAFDGYAWQPGGETTQTIDTDVDGEYIVTVTDANGCEANDTVLLVVNPLPTPDLGADQTICIGDAAVTFDAGSFDAYAWQPGGETTQTIDTDVAGEYIVTVTDAKGCEGTDTVNLIVNPLPTPDLGADQTICIGDAAVTFDAGAYDAYVWQPGGETTQTIDTDVAGEYIVTVTDANGCEGTDTVNLIVNPLPTPDLGADQEICAGDAAVTFDAGSFDGYTWQPGGETTQTIDTDVDGEYIVTVTDANGCEANDTVVLTVNPLPTPDLGADQAICIGDAAVTFDAGSFDAYAWQPGGETTQTIDTDVDGEYIVTVTDANGCEANDTVVLTVNPLPTPDLGADQTICIGDAAVTFDAGAYDDYAWQPGGETTQTIDTDIAGEYIVTVTDANGCEGIDTVNLIVNPLPTPDLGADQEICAGDAAVTFDAGSFDAYAWQPGGETIQTIDADVDGEYIVTVTDANGCEANDTVLLVVNPLPTPDLGTDQAICIGDAMVTFDAGSFDAYAWQPGGETTQTIDTDVDGEYIVTVTDANGCEANDTVLLTVNPLPTPDLGADQVICAGDAAVRFDAGSFDAYAWQPGGETTQTIDTDVDGEYIVTVTDANGCEANDTVLLMVNPLPTPDLGADQVICSGDPAVSFDAGAFDGYAWQPGGETTQTIDTDVDGEYVVTVTDANGCEANDTVLLTVNTLPTPDLGLDVEICEGGLGIIFDAGAYDSYAWYPRLETTQTITTDSAGAYAVEVTDANGCIGSDTVELFVNPNPTVDLGPNRTICPGSSVELDAGAGFTSYVWNDATMTQTKDVDDTNAGEYSVLVIDANSCSARDTVEVIVAAELSVDLGNDTAFCDGGMITVDAGAIAGATYAWQPGGESTQTIDISTTGEYSVLVTDPMGCSGRDTIVVTVNPNPTVDLGLDVTVCPDVDSMFTVGPGWTTITWSDGSSAEDLIVNTPGRYYVDVVDANGCTATDTAEFAFFAGATVDLGADITICPGTNANFDAGAFASYAWHDGSGLQTYSGTSAEKIWVDVVDANGCEAVDTAEIFMATSLPVALGNDTAVCEGESVTIQSGYPALGYTFTWAPTGEITNEITVSTAGTYDVLVEDVAGCTGRDTIVVSINPLPVVDLGPDKVVCEGDDDMFSAGAGWTSVVWNTSELTNDITVDSAGIYAVTVTDVNGCEDVDSVELVVNPNPTPDLGTDQTVCPGSQAAFDAGSYATYVWHDLSGLATYESTTEEKIWVTVTDANGCIGSDTADIYVRDALLVDLGSDLDTCDGNTVDILAGYSAAGGYSFTWNTGEATEQITVATSGRYYVDVVDANGCEGTDTVEITVHPNPAVDLGLDQSICDGEEFTFDAGAGWSSVFWNDASTNQTLDANSDGNYSVTVTDANGCEATDDVNLVVNANPTVDLGDDVEVCPGIEVTFNTDPTGFASYSWHDGSTGSDYSTINPERVWVDVIDANGCTATDTAELTNLPALNVVLPDDQTLCEGEDFEITVPGFDAALHTFAWNDGSSASTLTVNTTNTYSVFVSNGGGCAGFDTIRVEVNPNPVPVVDDVTVCEGEAALLGVSTSYAGYAWDNGEITREINVTTAGDYAVTVTDLNGCSGSTSGTFTIVSKPVIEDPVDQSACEGESITLSPTLPAGTYEWKPTGETTSTIEVTTGGAYEVVVTNAGGCKDSVIVNASFNLNPVLNLGNDVVICEGRVARIGTETGDNTLTWESGLVSNYLDVAVDGEFAAFVTDANGCIGRDTVEVRVATNPTVTASNDTTVCFDEIGELALTVESRGASVVWNHSRETDNEVFITNDGTYFVSAVNEDGCVAVDTVIISRKCVPSFFVPNAFTPDGDGFNDHFGPKGLNVYDFEFYVFNRWGEQIFASFDINNHWDGTYMGNECQIDVYVWKAYYRVENETGGLQREQQVGRVTLLR